jgi:hypothetical protein
MIQGTTYLNTNFPPQSKIKEDVIKNGYGIYEDVININFIKEVGEGYNPQCYGFYNSISYYQPSIGRLQEQEDGYPKDKSTFALLHFMVPLTFKHQDYSDGGLTIQNKQTKEIVDVDGVMKPGSVLFFDGALKHGVKKIIPLENKEPIGRLAFFAIPMFFHKNPEIASKSSANYMSSQKSGKLSKLLKKL